MAYHWMGMGEALGAAALTPNNKHQFAIWVAELINLYRSTSQANSVPLEVSDVRHER